VPLGVLWSLVLAGVWLNPLIEQPSTPGDRYGVLVFCLAAVVELTAEPVWMLGQEYQHVLLKVCWGLGLLKEVGLIGLGVGLAEGVCVTSNVLM